MSNKRTKLLAFGKSFIEKMEENDIWYSADLETILGAQRHGGFIPWVEKFQVIMTPDSFTKLQRIFPNNVISSFYSKEYKSLTPAFVEDRDNWQEEQEFIEIKLVVPTTIQKIKFFRSKIMMLIHKVNGRKETTRAAVNDLYDLRYEGFYVINTRTALAHKNWIPNITFHMEEMKFHNIKIKVIKEWKHWVVENYGEDYMKATLPNHIYAFPSPLRKVKEEEI